MKQHFLQSPLWEAYEQLEGNQTFRLEDDGYEAMVVLKSTPVGNYLFCPYGPSVKDAKSFKNSLSALKELAKKQGAFFIRIEPTFPVTNQSSSQIPDSSLSKLEMQTNSQNDNFSFSPSKMESLGLKKSHDLDPAHTWVLDLDKTEEELLNGMESRKVRYWRNHEKKNISLRQSKNPEDISILTTLLADLGDRDNFIPQNKNHLKNQLKSGFATLYIAEIDEESGKKPIAAALIYDYEDTRFYAHAAADNAYRKFVPGTIVLIQMILDAKKSGQKHYDFWGMTTSNDPNHPWYGFTQYKKSFGGYQVDYAGTWDLPLKPAKYFLYNLIRKANRLVRKIKH